MDTMILTDSKESINHTLSERNFDNDMIKQCELLSISKSIDRASSIQILHSLPIDVVSQKVLENIEIPKTDSKHIPDILSYIKTTNKIASLKPSLPNSQSKNKPTQHIQRQRIPVLSQSEVFSSSTANQNTIELPSLIRSLPPSWKLSITQKPSIQPKSKQSQIGGDDYVLSPFRPASNPFAFAEE